MYLLKMLLVLLVCAAAPAVAGPHEDEDTAYNRGDYSTAIGLLRPLADQGNASAQFVLRTMYNDGRGVPQDYAKATSWFCKAADQGDASSQLHLGNKYRHGEGVPQDYVQAHKWYILAMTASRLTASDKDSKISRSTCDISMSLLGRTTQASRPS